MKKRKTKTKKKNNSFRKLVAVFAISLSFAATTRVFSTATLSKINYEVEVEKQQIEDQEKTNESLTMIINELASLNKIDEVAQQQGLSYNNNNIRSVGE